jgi:hypothetical protein
MLIKWRDVLNARAGADGDSFVCRITQAKRSMPECWRKQTKHQAADKRPMNPFQK